MKNIPLFDKKTTVAAIAAVVAIVFGTVLLKTGSGQTTATIPAPAPAPATNATDEAVVTLAASQTNAIKVEPVGTHVFTLEKTAVGNIDYDEDLSVQVFSSYPGKIIDAFA